MFRRIVLQDQNFMIDMLSRWWNSPANMSKKSETRSLPIPSNKRAILVFSYSVIKNQIKKYKGNYKELW